MAAQARERLRWSEACGMGRLCGELPIDQMHGASGSRRCGHGYLVILRSLQAFAALLSGSNGDAGANVHLQPCA